ncbi:cyclic-phosphate processing receiver domain-containing protein [Undibacterium sp. Ji83W]|uniref:cyclic-phosphate processing receiver domain-containing protein n=1 Tax=Undibacterium sp. Ji83W TaxID=3413043 RepID=UPI003BF0D15B
MTNKTQKQLIDDYLKQPPDPALGKEDSFWANVTPVGREFGSKDYERLMAHDNLVHTAMTSPNPVSLALRVFLDDERATPEGWVRVYWPNEAIDLLKTNAVVEISLDHDLGDDQRGTGYDVVLWIEETVALHGFKPPKMSVHSANSSAREKMEAGIEAINRLVNNKPFD